MGLSYKITGRKLDGNDVCLAKNNIIWRSSLDLGDILGVLDRINARISSLDSIDMAKISLDFAPSVESRFYKSYKKANFYDNLLRDKCYKKLKNRDFRFLSKKFLQQKVRKNITRFYPASKYSTKYQNIESKPTKNFINTNIFLCQNKDWIDEYQKSIKPIICGRFYIRPSWHPPLKSFAKNSKNNNIIESNLIDLIIDPSLSFGSGHHASTAMCINFLSNLDSKNNFNLKNKSMLDVGCGSGILSLVGASLGARVKACDVDSFAISQTQKNFKINNLSYKKLWCGSITKDFKKYDIIVANIITSIILILKNELINNLKENGILILSGILKEKENDILSNFSSLKLLESQQIDEWISFMFQK